MLKLISYEFKAFLREKNYIIWMLIFPLAYFTVFYFSIGRSIHTASFEIDPFSVGILTEETAQAGAAAGTKAGSETAEAGKTAETAAGANAAQAGDDELLKSVLQDLDFIELKTESPSREDLEQDLREEKLAAYIYKNDQGLYQFMTAKNKVQISSSLQQVLEWVNQGILTGTSIREGFMEGHLQLSPELQAAYREMLASSSREPGKEDMASLPSGTAEPVTFEGVQMESKGKGLTPDYITLFAALAYLAFYPIQAGLTCTDQVQANQSRIALRKATSPVSKRKLFFASLIPLVLFQSLVTLLAYAYSQALGIEFGDHGGVILLILLGTLAAIFTGTLLGALFPKKPGLKMGLSIMLPLLFSMMSGMMSFTVSQAFRKSVPWLADHNPVSLITRGLYILYAQGWGPLFNQKIYSLLIYIAVTAALSFLLIRRDDYESL